MSRKIDLTSLKTCSSKSTGTTTLKCGYQSVKSLDKMQSTSWCLILFVDIYLLIECKALVQGTNITSGHLIYIYFFLLIRGSFCICALNLPNLSDRINNPCQRE